MAHRGEPKYRFDWGKLLEWRWIAALGFISLTASLIGVYLTSPATLPAARQTPPVTQLPVSLSPSPSRSPSPPPQARVYAVKLGDTLASIAMQFYGSAADWQRIQRANAALLAKHNGLLIPGMVLVIPLWLWTTGCCAALPAASMSPG